jgi:twitching motility protein PilT
VLVRAVASQAIQEELAKRGATTFAFAYGQSARMRAHATTHAGGWSLTLRVLPAPPPSIEELGLAPVVMGLCRNSRGLFVVAGPSGSGRTTVVASLVEYLNERVGGRYIVTLGRTIEYASQPRKAMIVQRQVGPDVATFVAGIEQLRLDAAHVGVVDELEDDAAICAAVEAAHRDCLIIATLPARSATEAVERLLAAGGANAASHLRRVSKCLLAVLCTELCPRTDRPGLMPAYEFLVNTPAVAEFIRAEKLAELDSAIRTGKKHGMQRLDDALLRLFDRGIITAETALDRARNAVEVQARLDRRAANGPPAPDAPDDGDAPKPAPGRPHPPADEASAAANTDS